MGMYLVKTPPIIRSVFSDLVWKVDGTDSKEVFLTFDDGPVPTITPWVLDIMRDYHFKGTFFCVGDNVRKYRNIYDRILNEGHMTGNHTYHHINGWTTDHEEYLDDVAKCDATFDSVLFRPPYGKMRPGQSTHIKNTKTIIMWDVLSGDFDHTITPEKCLNNVIENYSKGSIIVFHDSLKSETNLRYALPRVLEHLAENDFVSSSLECLVMENV